MISYLLTAVIGLLIILCLKPKNFPDGPPRLPIVGSLPFMMKNFKTGGSLLHNFQHVTAKYGKCVGLYLGSKQSVLISDFEMIKDAMKMKETSLRPPLYPSNESRIGHDLPNVPEGGSLGIILSNGEIWQEQRRFVSRNLRDMGFGKTTMEDSIGIEVMKLTKHFSSLNGAPFNPVCKMNISILNALWVLMSGQSLELDDPKMEEIVNDLNTVAQEGANVSVLTALMPIPSLLKIPYIYEKTGHALEKKLFGRVEDFMKKVIHERLENKNEDASDLLDILLAHVSSMEDKSSSFHKNTSGMESTINILTDLFVAGMETTSTTLLWVFIFLMRNPHMQKKIRDEINQFAGSENLPTLHDREKMHFTNAFIEESYRKASFAHCNVPHYTEQDVKVGDHIIPAKTTIFCNLYNVMNDPDYWKDPDTFNPDRFLDESGHFHHDERVIPFSVGRRYCLGQPLAEKEVFLFLTGIVQRFDIELAPGQTMPRIDIHASYPTGLLRTPPSYEIILKPVS